MKYGMRKPSWKKSLSARTIGRAKRAIKRSIIPAYGKRVWDGCIPNVRYITECIEEQRLVFSI